LPTCKKQLFPVGDAGKDSLISSNAKGLIEISLRRFLLSQEAANPRFEPITCHRCFPSSRLHLQFFRGGEFALIGIESEKFPRAQVQRRRHKENIETACLIQMSTKPPDSCHKALRTAI
jgi:hypothetical protein